MRASFGLVLLCSLLLAACGGEDAAPPPTEAEARLRRGLVSISEDETPAYSLDWQAPQAAVDANDLPEALTRAQAALEAGRLYQDAEAAIPLYLAILKLAPENEAARAGRRVLPVR